MGSARQLQRLRDPVHPLSPYGIFQFAPASRGTCRMDLLRTLRRGSTRTFLVRTPIALQSPSRVRKIAAHNSSIRGLSEPYILLTPLGWPHLVWQSSRQVQDQEERTVGHIPGCPIVA